MTRRSCPEHRARSSELGSAAESSRYLHRESGHVRFVGPIELNEHSIAALVWHTAQEIQPWPAALGSRVQVQIAKIGVPDHHTVAQRTMGGLQIGHRLTMIGYGGGDTAVGTGA